MKRITYKDVTAAYRQTGWEPMHGQFTDTFGDRKRACPLTTLAAVKLGIKELGKMVTMDTAKMYGAIGVTRKYALGFWNGFDGIRYHHSPINVIIPTTEEELQGQFDGFNIHLQMVLSKADFENVANGDSKSSTV